MTQSRETWLAILGAAERALPVLFAKGNYDHARELADKIIVFRRMCQ